VPPAPDARGSSQMTMRSLVLAGPPEVRSFRTRNRPRLAAGLRGARERRSRRRAGRKTGGSGRKTRAGRK
jgi:hypothetical protein